MIDKNIFKEKSYDELIIEKSNLNKKYTQIEDDALKEGLSFDAFCEKAHDVKNDLFIVDKYIRAKEDPILTFGKEWKGILYTLDKFKKMCNDPKVNITDEDGVGYYAIENGTSNIVAKPSDFHYNIIRNDFTHILWIEKEKELI